MTVSFFIDQVAESFIIGLFQNQKLSLYNKDYQADFVLARMETVTVNIPEENVSTVRLWTLFSMVTAEKNSGLRSIPASGR